MAQKDRRPRQPGEDLLNLADWALSYADLGWPVLPLHTWNGHTCTCGAPDCSSPAKHPRTRNGLKDATTSSDKIRSWWGRWPEANIGLRTGIAFDVLDVDGDPGFQAVGAMENAHGDSPAGPTSHTGGGGAHRLYQPTGIGNRAGILDHVDWRGRNGYIVAPPSLHASGNRYEWAEAPLDHTGTLQAVTGWLRDLLFPPQPQPRPAASPTKWAGSSVYAQRAFDAELGELARAGQGTRNNTLNDCAFNLYQLVYGGELDEHTVTEALARVATGIGLGQREIDATLRSARAGAQQTPRSVPKLTVIGNTARKLETPHHTPNTAAGPDRDPADDDNTTGWEPADIAGLLASDLTIPAPQLYARTDGTCLLYAAKIHAFNGEPESGKSWAAQHATTQTLAAGLNVIYLDFEDSPQSVLGRLLALGATPHQLTDLFTYIQPDRPLSPDAGETLRDHLRTHRPALAIIDGVTEAMSTLGLEPLDNADTAKFFRALPRPLAKNGAAVILVDHVVKDRENRGRWAIGSQHKMAALTGAAYTIEVATPFGRNKHGIAKLTVTKDRPGYIRQHAAGSLAAELHLHSNGDTLTCELVAPSSSLTEDGVFRPTALMQKISWALAHGPALTGKQVRAAVRGKDETISLALRLLVTEGYVQAHKQGQAVYHSHIKPFPNPTDDTDDTGIENDELY